MAKPPATTRQRNLRELIAQWGGGEALAKKLGYSNGSYLSHMATGHRPITEKTVQRIEETLGLPRGWMEQERATKEVSAPVDTALFTRCVEAVGMAMQEMGTSLSVEKFEEVVLLMYEHTLTVGRCDEALLRRVIALAR
jgi:hypothetical protein